MGLLDRIMGRKSPVLPPGVSLGPVSQPLYFRAPGQWSMAAVESAIDAHERGEFQESGRLADACIADEYVSSLSSLRVGTFTGLPKALHSADCSLVVRDGSPEATCDCGGAAGGTQARQDFAELFPATLQDWVLAGVRWMGFSLIQDTRISYDELPRWTPWPHDSVRYDVWRDVWQVRTRDRGLVDIQPNTGGRWVLFTGRMLRPWLAAFVRSVPPMMVIRQATGYNWANHAQVYATPSRVLTSDKRMAETEDVQRAISYLRRLVGDTTIILPEGLRLELLELKGKSTPEIYDRLRQSIDANLGVLFLGQTGTAKAGGSAAGSYLTERRVTQQLLEADHRVIQPVAHRLIMAPYDAWRRGTRDLRSVPVPWWDVTPPQDRMQEADRRYKEALADYQHSQEIAQLAKVQLPDGYRIDLRRLSEMRGLPVERGEAQPAQTVQPAKGQP